MLELHIEETELWDPVRERFFSVKEQTLPLEHSLLSVSKWESKWHKPMPLMNDEGMGFDEFIDYVRCMTVSRRPDPLVYSCLTAKDIDAIRDYINDPHTATWFGESTPAETDNRPMTAERIYHLMFAFGVDISCEKWHLNRLMTQIRVEYEESKPAKKKTPEEIAEHHRMLNAKRRAERAARRRK